MYNQKKATSLLTDLTRNTGSAVTMTPKIMWNTTMILLNVSLTFPSAMGSAPKIRNHQKNALKFRKFFILNYSTSKVCTLQEKDREHNENWFAKNILAPLSTITTVAGLYVWLLQNNPKASSTLKYQCYTCHH